MAAGRTISKEITDFGHLEGARDGVYRVCLDGRGNEVHESLQARAAPESAPEAAPDMKKRVELGEIFCGCGFNLVPSDCDAAVADLENQLGNGVTIDFDSYYSIRGAVVAFVCSRSSDFPISGSDYSQYVSDVTSECGRYIAGTYFAVGDGADQADIGYMQYYSGLDFCAHAEGSSSHSC